MVGWVHGDGAVVRDGLTVWLSDDLLALARSVASVVCDAEPRLIRFIRMITSPLLLLFRAGVPPVFPHSKQNGDRRRGMLRRVDHGCELDSVSGLSERYRCLETE